MNCARAQRLLSEERDRPLTSTEVGALEPHVAGCAECRQFRLILATTAHAWRQSTREVTPPSATATWHAVRRQARSARSPQPAHRRWWAAAPVAAAAALAVAVWFKPPALAPADPAIARAVFVEPGDARATTLVYVDEPTGWLIVWAAPAAES